MKTKLSLLMTFLSCFKIVMSQSPLSIDDYKMLGESQYVVVYEMSYLKDISKPDRIYHDEIILEISGE